MSAYDWEGILMWAACSAYILLTYWLVYGCIVWSRNRCKHTWELLGQHEQKEGTAEEWKAGTMRIKRIVLVSRCKDCAKVKRDRI